MTSWSIRSIIGVMCVLVCATVARADRMEEITRMHLEAIGGQKRVEALSSLRATGQVLIGGKRVRFTMTAARPNLLRLETENTGRTLVQGYDGKNEPWEFDTGSWPPRYRSLAEGAQKTFIADAEFDDPLVGGAKRGFKLEYVDVVLEEGRPLLRVRVTRDAATYALLVDPNTYLIAWRVEERKTATGEETRILTYYDDYRAINGVLIAHRLSVVVNGKPSQQTAIERVDANPKHGADTFARPAAAKGAPSL